MGTNFFRGLVLITGTPQKGTPDFGNSPYTDNYDIVVRIIFGKMETEWKLLYCYGDYYWDNGKQDGNDYHVMCQAKCKTLSRAGQTGAWAGGWVGCWLEMLK